MYAALVNLTIDPAQAPAAAAAFTNDILPRVRSAEGFVGGYWVDPVDGQGFGFVLFETDAASVQFSGTITESAKYSFIVWGYNRAGCVHTDVATTVVRPAPGAVGDVRSEMAWLNAETWDRYIDDVEAGTPRLQITAVDAAGARIGSPKDFGGSGWLRQLLNRPFGETARFQVRACSVWGSCGPWSQTLPSGDSPTLTFALPGRAYDAATTTWSWTAAPANNGLPAAYRCGVDGDRVGRVAQSATSCQVNGAKAGDRVWLDVEVAGVTARFESR